MRRGDVVIIAAPGDYGKPRPAVVIQSNQLNATGIKSVAVCLITSSLNINPTTRVPLIASPENGLQHPSNIMAEKLFTLPITKVSQVIGRLTPFELNELDHSLAFVLGL